MSQKRSSLQRAERAAFSSSPLRTDIDDRISVGIVTPPVGANVGLAALHSDRVREKRSGALE